MKKELENIINIVVDSVETEFHVDIKSDCGGAHFCIYLPGETNTKVLRSKLDSIILSKRYIIVFVPPGEYIDLFLRNPKPAG
tara:strand:- start:95 stop:340 length:246 start_codon:yes stop_codon:yes gene_type:complete